MSLKINRFEAYQIKRAPAEIKLHSSATVLIKDHLDDGVISFIQLNGDLKENNELAELIIKTIEDFIEGEGTNDDSEDTH